MRPYACRSHACAESGQFGLSEQQFLTLAHAAGIVEEPAVQLCGQSIPLQNKRAARHRRICSSSSGTVIPLDRSSSALLTLLCSLSASHLLIIREGCESRVRALEIWVFALNHSTSWLNRHNNRFCPIVPGLEHADSFSQAPPIHSLQHSSRHRAKRSAPFNNRCAHGRDRY